MHRGVPTCTLKITRQATSMIRVAGGSCLLLPWRSTAVLNARLVARGCGTVDAHVCTGTDRLQPLRARWMQQVLGGYLPALEAPLQGF